MTNARCNKKASLLLELEQAGLVLALEIVAVCSNAGFSLDGFTKAARHRSSHLIALGYCANRVHQLPGQYARRQVLRTID